MTKFCKYCERPIEFRKTSYGKWMPVEPDPIDPRTLDASDLCFNSKGETMIVQEVPEGEQVWLPHWPKCEGANSFRKPKAKDNYNHED